MQALMERQLADQNPPSYPTSVDTAIGGNRYHYGPADESCPCIKADCGYAELVDDWCLVHGPLAPKNIFPIQHHERDCPFSKG